MEEKEGKIYTVDDCEEEMLFDLRNGKQKGSTTHVSDLDEAWKWRQKEFNIWTGYANEGKSLFIKQLAMIKAITDGWKSVFSSPEEFPPKEFFDDCLHTLTGQSTDKDNPRRVDEEYYQFAMNQLRENIYFHYLKPPGNTIETVLQDFRMLIDSDPDIKITVIDPLLKFARPKGFSERDDVYASYIGSLSVDFAREMDVSHHLVMHQVTPKVGDDKCYPEPSMYSMKGGGSWADGADNVLSIWRPYYARDKVNDEVQFASQKIKKQKLVGIPQRIKMKFDRRSNRYMDFNNSSKPLFNFDYILKGNYAK